MAKTMKTRTAEEDMLRRLKEIAKAATDDERLAVDGLVKTATGAEHSCALYRLSPAVCAIIFLHHNAHNRNWEVPGVLELLRQINNDAWKFNSNGAGFFNTGMLADSQHRFAAHALADKVLEIPITFGVDPDAADTIDCGKRRDGSDGAAIKHGRTFFGSLMMLFRQCVMIQHTVF